MLHQGPFAAFHGVEVAVSRPGSSWIGSVILRGGFPTPVAALFPPAHASTQALVLLTKFEGVIGLGVRTVSLEIGK